ncbi:hypothetical protein [Bradyrhizobium sp. CCBAU 53338]|uniref:hypothetical protein n=1 Tax=Bradyrhizobium sp. CCBAU 53338 TaxID=1325111 RepID=UPI00188A0AF9|nr:hypothetical protein [Bradyrhizobium sp. CCBAU 53338]
MVVSLGFGVVGYALEKIGIRIMVREGARKSVVRFSFAIASAKANFVLRGGSMGGDKITWSLIV